MALVEASLRNDFGEAFFLVRSLSSGIYLPENISILNQSPFCISFHFFKSSTKIYITFIKFKRRLKPPFGPSMGASLNGKTNISTVILSFMANLG